MMSHSRLSLLLARARRGYCWLALTFLQRKMGFEDPTPDEQAVIDWAQSNKVSVDCVKLLLKDGFSSMEALELLEEEDLSPKIARGQHRLIVKAIRALKRKFFNAEYGSFWR